MSGQVGEVKEGDLFRVETIDWTAGQIKDNDSAEDMQKVDLSQVTNQLMTSLPPSAWLAGDADAFRGRMRWPVLARPTSAGKCCQLCVEGCVQDEYECDYHEQPDRDMFSLSA